MTDVVKGDLYIGINSDLADRLGADCKHQRETEARSRAASLEGMRPKKKKGQKNHQAGRVASEQQHPSEWK